MTTLDLPYDQITSYFHLPISEASKKLKICQTNLKKICRKNGINRWPHRKFQCINTNIKEYEKLFAETLCDVEKNEIKQQIQHLKDIKEQLYQNSNIELNQLISKSKMQTCRKRNRECYNEYSLEINEKVVRQKLDINSFNSIEKLIVVTALSYRKILTKEGTNISNNLEEYVCMDMLLKFTAIELSSQ